MNENEKKAKAVPEDYLPVFCEELYQLTMSGITPADGLELLRDDETQPDLRQTLDTLCELTRDGLPLGEAMRSSGSFPDYMTDMIDLAENTGRLQDTLPALQRYYARKYRLKAEIRSAVTAPAALLAVMVAVVVLLITQVLPVFDRVFAQLGVSMGAVARTMMRAGTALARAGTGLAAVLAAIALAAAAVAFIPALRERFLSWFRYRFGGKGVLGEMAVSRFASSMAMACASGIDMEEAVSMAAKICGGAGEIDRMTAECEEKIRNGHNPADALAESGLFSGRDCGLLRLSERTGSLPDTLESISARLEEDSLRHIDSAVGSVEPVIVLITGALAALILLSVLLPMMGLLSGVG